MDMNFYKFITRTTSTISSTSSCKRITTTQHVYGYWWCCIHTHTHTHQTQDPVLLA